MAYLKNEVLEVEITDMSDNGEGIGKVDGYTLFVKDALIGDVVKAGLTKVKKNYAYARCVEIVKKSELRVKPKCTYHKQCGGCQIQAMSYEAQLRFKADKVKNDLVRIGGFKPELIEKISEPIIGMDNPYRYRNKAQYPFGLSKDGEIIAGFYAGRTHSIISNTDCYLGVEENEEILAAVISYMKENDISPYDENTGKGIVRHVLIRKGFVTGEIMVCVIINADRLQKEDKLVAKLKDIPGMTSVCININKSNTNVIMGRKCETIWGEDTITDYIGDVKFKISPLSFFQVNPVQTKKLYEKALEYAAWDEEKALEARFEKLSGSKNENNGSEADLNTDDSVDTLAEGLSDKNVWDLYCGIGTISLFLAQKAKHVTGVEIIPQAIEDAKENARINGLTNTTFFTGAAEDLAEEIAAGSLSTGERKTRAIEQLAVRIQENGIENISELNCNADISDVSIPDIIVVDPPRKGCDEKLLNTILAVCPERIVYVSCDPATLSRDLKILCESGKYELKRVCPVDQFPHTVHCESVCLLSKVNTRD